MENINDWVYSGKLLLEGKKLDVIELNGKVFKLNPVQSEFICNFKDRYCLNAGGFGCLEGKSRIQTPNGEITIEELYNDRIAPFVYSYVNGKIKKARATVPIKYEKAQLFKVKFGNREIIATAKHRFLTKRGWVKLSDLSVGEELLGYIPFPHESISDSVQSTLLSNVFHLFRRVLSFLNGYRSFYHSYDVPLLSATRNDQDVIPLQDDVHEHNRQNYNKGDRYSSLKHNQTYQQSFHPSRNNSEILFPSSQNPLVLNEEGYTLKSTFEYIFGTFQLRLKSLWNFFYHCIKVLINRNSFFSSYPKSTINEYKVQSITPYGIDNYYDLHVFGTNNYLAEGIFHHNSGKSLALYIKLLLHVMCFPNNRVLLGRKTLSDLDRTTLPDLFELIPKTWYTHRVKDGVINFNNGSQIILFGLDAMQSGSIGDIKKAQQKLKSLNLGAYFIDQLEEVEWEVIKVLNSRLRKMEVPFRQGNTTCNPANFWAYDKYVVNPAEDYKLYQSSMYDNRDNLPEDYIREQESYGEDYVRRFVKGEWTTDVLLKGTVFAKEHIRELELMVKPPLRIEEECEIYEDPKDIEYRIGVDPSEGVVDPSSISVVSFEGRKVAKFNGKVPISALADKVKFLYYKYKKPLIIPEANSSGTALIREIRDLRIYKRKHLEYKTDIETEKLGFRTSWDSKQQLIQHFQTLLRQRKPKIYDKKTIEEMKTFLWNDVATQMGAGAARGFHDDDIMSTLLAYWEFDPVKIIEIQAAKSMPIRKKQFQYI